MKLLKKIKNYISNFSNRSFHVKNFLIFVDQVSAFIHRWSPHVKNFLIFVGQIILIFIAHVFGLIVYLCKKLNVFLSACYRNMQGNSWPWTILFFHLFALVFAYFTLIYTTVSQAIFGEWTWWLPAVTRYGTLINYDYFTAFQQPPMYRVARCWPPSCIMPEINWPPLYFTTDYWPPDYIIADWRPPGYIAPKYIPVSQFINDSFNWKPFQSFTDYRPIGHVAVHQRYSFQAFVSHRDFGFNDANYQPLSYGDRSRMEIALRYKVWWYELNFKAYNNRRAMGYTDAGWDRVSDTYRIRYDLMLKQRMTWLEKAEDAAAAGWTFSWKNFFKSFVI